MAFKPVRISEEDQPPGFKPLVIEDTGEKSFVGKAVDAYDKYIDPLRRTATSAVNKGVEVLQDTPLTKFATDPIDTTVGLAKDVVKAGVRGFQGKEDKRGKDILKAIPEAPDEKVTFPEPAIQKAANKLADKFISYIQKKDDGTEVERFSKLEPGDDEQLSALTGEIEKLVNFMPDLISKGTLRAGQAVLSQGKNISKLTAPLVGAPPSGEFSTSLANVPKRVSEFSIDALADPLNYLLPLASKGGKALTGRLMASETVANGLKTALQTLKSHPGLKVFQRAYGAPKAFIESLDQTTLRVAKLEEQALEHAQYMKETFTPAELKRIKQIAESSRDLDTFKTAARPDLYEAALKERELFNGVEDEARQLGMLKDTFTTRLSRKELAKLRTEREALTKEMSKYNQPGGFFPHRERILDMANKIGIQGNRELASELRSTADNYKLLGKKNREAFTTIVDTLGNSKNLPVQEKGRFLNLLMKVDKVGLDQRQDVINQMFDIADNVDDLKVKGLKPLIQYVTNAHPRFKGQASLVREFENDIDAITNRIHLHYTQGGKGYMPRLYDFFEKGYHKKLGDVGLKLKDIAELKEGELAALNSLNKGEFDELISKLRQIKSEGYGKKILGIPNKAFGPQRKEITQEFRKALGEIQSADYLLARGFPKQARAVEFQKFYQTVAQNPEWAQPLKDFNDAPKEGWMKMPESKTLGALSGMMVRDDIGRELQYTARSLGKWQEAWLKGLSAWKSGKVLYNPATHFRNFMSNMILMDASGVDLLEQPRLVTKSARELINKGKYWKEAKDAGLFTNSGYADAELRTFLSGFEKVKDDMVSRAIHAAKEVTEKLGQSYSSNESVFKLAKFIHSREQGVPVKEAFDEAEKWLFNYNKLAPATRMLRSVPFGSPFITFTAKSLPRMAESFVNNPLRLYKYRAMFNALENQAKDKLGMNDDDVRYIKKGFPGTGLVLPIADAEGNPHVLDLSYILPWGDITEGSGASGIPAVIPPGGPLKALLEVRQNYSDFTGKPIRNKTENYHIQAADTLDYLAKAALPSLTPGIPGKESPMRGGYSFNKIVSALKKQPDYMGRVRSLGMVIADTMMGLKAYPQDPEQLRAFQAITTKRSVQDRINIFKRVLRHPGVSEEAKARERARFTKDIQNIFRAYND